MSDLKVAMLRDRTDVKTKVRICDATVDIEMSETKRSDSELDPFEKKRRPVTTRVFPGTDAVGTTRCRPEVPPKLDDLRRCLNLAHCHIATSLGQRTQRRLESHRH